jgi:signal transduction histidine kinase
MISLKKILLILFFISSSAITVLLPQDKSQLPDSLLNSLNTKDVKEKIKVYTDIMMYCIRVKPQDAILYGNEALKLAKDENYRKGEADILYVFGVSHHAQSEYSEAMVYFKASYEIRKSENDNVGIGECLNRMGLIYNVQGDYEKALDYCLQSVRILENENDIKALGRAYNHLGIIYYIINDMPKAKEIMLKSLSFCERINDDLILAVSHEHLGIFYIKKNEYDKALFHINKSKELREAKNDLLGLSGSYDNLAIIYRNLEKFKDAITYFQKSIELKNRLENKRGMASSLAGIGLTYYKMGQYEKGLNNMKEAFEIRKELNDKRGMVASLIRLADIYAAMGDFKNAYESTNLSKSYSDSLLNEQKNKAIAQLQEEFQTERKSKEILLLQKENTIQSYFQTLLIILAFALSIITISIFVAYSSKKKNNVILVKSNQLITDQKEELYLLNSQLKELNATKDKLFSIIAHDLKSPLHGLMGLLQVMLDDIKELSLEEICEFTEGMRDSVNHIYKLIENLLEWALFQRHMIEFNPEKVNLYECVNDIINAQKSSFVNKSIQVTNNITKDISFQADINMLHTILRNLFSNAIKFTERNGKVELNCTEKDSLIQFSITDSGIGIPVNMIPKLFHAGEKTSRPGTDGESSSGLGLVLCKDYIDKHNGKIWVDSEPDIGTTFFVSLPKE